MQEDFDVTYGDLIGYVLMLACCATIAPYAAKGAFLLIRIAWSWYCYGR